MLKNITKLSGNIVKNKWYQWVAIILSYTYIIIYYVNNLTKTIDSMVKICYHYAVFSYKGFFISSEKTPTSISGEWRINIIKPRRSWIYAMLENFGNMTHNIENNLELPVRTKWNSRWWSKLFLLFQDICCFRICGKLLNMK